MAQTLDEYYKSLASIYDPQIGLINQQMAALPEQYKAQTTALEQAKINAFRDIANMSSARGAGWSGFRPGEEATYTGEKYLPALAALKTQQTSQMTELQKAINSLNAERGTQARNYYEQAIADEADRAWRAAEAQKERDFTAAQNAAKQSYGGGGGYTEPTPTPTPYTTQSSNGGTNFFDPSGNPITAAQYFGMVGGNVNDLLSFLDNDMDPTSRKAAQYYRTNGRAAAQSKYSWIFGGI